MPAPSSFREDNLLNAIQRYLEGEFRLSEAAKSVNLGAPRFKREMQARGFSARTPSQGQALRHVRDADSAWKRDFDQKGAVAREQWINSPANKSRMSQLGGEASRRNRGRRASEESLSARSVAHQEGLLKVSPVALNFRDVLAARGLDTVLEQAAGRYNIDIAVGRVAVEVHRYSFNPLGPTRLRERKRTRYLCDRGWLVCYVWVRPSGGFLLTADAADHVVALVQAAQRDPSLVGEYRVIRGTGELVAAGRGDGDELT